MSWEKVDNRKEVVEVLWGLNRVRDRRKRGMRIMGMGVRWVESIKI